MVCDLCGEEDLWDVCPSCHVDILFQLYGQTPELYNPKYAQLVELVKTRPDADKWIVKKD